MKKVLLLLATILLLAALAPVYSGCGGGEAEPTTTPTVEPTAPVAEPIELKFSYWPPPADPWVQQGILPWGPEVEEKTGGQVKVTYFGGSSLGAPPDHLDLVMNGTADIGWINPAFTPGVFPLTDIRNLPFLYPTVEVAAKVFWRQQEYINPIEFDDLVHTLFTFPTPPMELSMRTKPVKVLEDLKGVKLGETEPTAAKTDAILGAVPVVSQETELYTGLERGMLDGRFQEYNGLLTWKCGEVTKYRTDNIRIFVHQNAVVMNKEKYYSLPDDVRRVIDEVSGMNWSTKTGPIWAGIEENSKQIILEADKAAGNPPPYILPEEERARWVEATAPAIDEWLQDLADAGKGNEAQELLDMTRQWIQEYS